MSQISPLSNCSNPEVNKSRSLSMQLLSSSTTQIYKTLGVLFMLSINMSLIGATLLLKQSIRRTRDEESIKNLLKCSHRYKSITRGLSFRCHSPCTFFMTSPTSLWCNLHHLTRCKNEVINPDLFLQVSQIF